MGVLIIFAMLPHILPHPYRRLKHTQTLYISYYTRSPRRYLAQRTRRLSCMPVGLVIHTTKQVVRAAILLALPHGALIKILAGLLFLLRVFALNNCLLRTHTNVRTSLSRRQATDTANKHKQTNNEHRQTRVTADSTSSKLVFKPTNVSYDCDAWKLIPRWKVQTNRNSQKTIGLLNRMSDK